MRMAINDNEVELGFQLIRKQGNKKHAVVISNLSYDIALISEEIEQAQTLLSRVEMNASETGLQINSEKTNIMSFAKINPVNIYTIVRIHYTYTYTLNSQITIVYNLKYLRSWMSSSLKDLEFRK